MECANKAALLLSPLLLLKSPMFVCVSALTISSTQRWKCQAPFSCCSQPTQTHQLLKTTPAHLLQSVTTASSGTENQQNIRWQIESILGSLSSNETKRTKSSAKSTKVFIIGTGLSAFVSDLPLSTLAILASADVVLHDSLSLDPDEIRRIVPLHCVVQNVGKRGDDREGSFEQREIDELLVRHAKSNLSHKTVVRLKGGDPFLFGRSRTEIESLREHSIPYEVIPNLSSCVAGPHFGGIPLTDPKLGAQSFAVFSGTNAGGIGLGSDSRGERNWENMDVDTLIFLMVGRLDKLHALCHCLAKNGGRRWDESTSCAIIQNAGRKSSQKVWRSKLGTLVNVIKADLGDDVPTVSPAILVVGQTTSLDLLEE